MAFLDNSGDIILDAVLTDTGRMRLAKGDGSFRIAKFAFGDDEIDYSEYDKNNASGSAYYDLDILQTPILEAFTNNTSFLKSKLMTIPRTNLLYLPVMEINTILYEKNTKDNIYVVSSDQNTSTELATLGSSVDWSPGIIDGVSNDSRQVIIVEQGLDTTEIPSSFRLDPDLIENQYIVEMDNRIGQITDANGTPAPVSFIDDDNIASYYLSRGAGSTAFIQDGTGINNPPNQTADTPIAGPRGTKFQFSLKPSVELQSSTYLFSRLGSTQATKAGSIGKAVADAARYSGGIYLIDTIIRVTGGQTGYRLDIPVRFIKVKD